MRRPRVILLLSAVSVLSAARAQSTAKSPAPDPPASSSIAVVNFNAAVLGTAEAQRSLGALQKKFAPREEEMQKLSDEIEAAKRNLQEASDKLTEPERDRKLQDLAAKEKQLQREAEDFKNDSQAASQQAFQQVAQKLFSLLQEFSRQHGYAAVLERGTESAPVVWYTAGNVDITDQLIKSFDAKYAAGASLPDMPPQKHTLPPAAPKQP